MSTGLTCGQGLAHHSRLPAEMGDVIAALAANLEIHMTALDLADENGRKEHAAYSELAKAHRSIADQLHATAKRMAGYSDLPMAKHDMSVMTSAKVVAAFETLVTGERELLILLQSTLEEHGRMLLALRGASSAPV